MSKCTTWGNKDGYWVDHISSKQDTTTISVNLSTNGHGGCITVHGSPAEIMERVNTILNAFNNEDLPNEN
jgi:hypothetical protein